MPTAFATISGNVRDAITGATALGRGRVLRGRDVPLPAADSRGVRVNTLVHDGEMLDLGGEALKWKGVLAVTCMARASADGDAESAIDDLLADVWQRVQSMPMPAGVTSLRMQPRIEYGLDELDQTVSTARFLLQIDHVTTATTLVAPT